MVFPLLSLTSLPSPILTLRIIHRSGLKSKIHKRSISSSFSLSLHFSLVSVALSFSTRICFALHIPFSFSFLIFSLRVFSRRQSTRFYRRLYVNSVICKNDRKKCFRGVHISKTRSVNLLPSWMHATYSLSHALTRPSSPFSLSSCLLLSCKNILLSRALCSSPFLAF